MNKIEYLAALRRALSCLPSEEQANALRYYEEYFDDAGPENEARVIAELGDPAGVAQAILNDYREVGAATVPQGTGIKRRGISPWALLVIVLLAIPLGLPLLGMAVGLLVAAFGVLVAITIIPIVLVVLGIALCWAAFPVLFASPASAVFTLGGGLICTAIGLLFGALLFKVLSLFVPPLMRGFVNLCRKPFERKRQV